MTGDGAGDDDDGDDGEMMVMITLFKIRRSVERNGESESPGLVSQFCCC
jgi:hypothetical protein